MTTVSEHDEENKESKEQKRKELLEAIQSWKPSMAEQELFNDEDYWEQSAEEAVKELDKKLGWNNDGNGNGKTNKNSPSKVDAATNNEKEESVKLSKEVIGLIEPMIVLLFKNKLTDSAFAAIRVNGHREIVPIHKSNRFDLWIRKAYYDATGKTLGSQIIREVVDTLEAKAILCGRVETLTMTWYSGTT